MSQKLLALIEKARRVQMTPEEREAQRISFAYGNVRFDNENITREAIARASDDLKDQTHEQGQHPKQ